MLKPFQKIQEIGCYAPSASIASWYNSHRMLRIIPL